MRPSVAMALLIGLLLAAQTALAAGPPDPEDPAIEAALLSITNRVRGEARLRLLETDERLAAAARSHAREMAALGFFDHLSPEPERRTVLRRVALAGSPLLVLGENLALIRTGRTVAEAAVEGWLASPGHRANLLEPSFTHVGFGTARNGQGEILVVQVLAYQPAQLLTSSVRSASARRMDLRLTLFAPAPVEAAIALGDGRPEPVRLPAGEVTLVLEADASEELGLRIGVRKGEGSSYLLEDAGRWQADSRGWQPDPALPRRAVEVRDLRAETVTVAVVEVVLSYPPDVSRTLVLFVEGTGRQVRANPAGEFRVRTPVEALPTRLSVGVLRGGSEAVIFQRFELARTLESFVLLPAGD